MPTFEVGYVGVDGHRRRENLPTVAEVAFEQALQVRTFPAFRGQRNNTGFPGGLGKCG